MGEFRPRSDVELAKLGEEELIAYVVEAREAGDADAMKVALQVFAFRREPAILGFVRARMHGHGDADIEQVVGQSIADAVEAIVRFKGETAGEAGSFVMRIVRRRVADFLRKGRIDANPLEWEGEDGERKSLVPGREDPRLEGLCDWSLIDQAFQDRSPKHQRALLHFFFDDLSAREAAAAVNRHFADEDGDPMTEDNVNQIASRFRKRIAELLRQTESPQPQHDG